MKKLLSTLTIVGLLSLPLFAQSGTKLIGFDASTIGRGGTSIGYFNGPDLMMSNPAGISFLENSQINANFSLLVPSLHFKNNLNDTDGKTNYFPMPDVSYISKTDSKLTWGIGFFTQGGMGADFTLNHALFVDQNGNFVPQTYHSKLAVMQGGPSVAYKLSKSFSVGVSAQLVYSMLEFQMPYSLSPSVMAGVVNPQTGMTFGQMFAASPQQGGFGYQEVTAAANMTDLTATGFTGNIGLAYKLNDKLSFGLSYSLPISLTYKNGKATMDMTAQLNDAFGKAVMGYMAQNPGATQQDAQAAVMQQFSQMGIDLQKGAADSYNLEVKLKFPQSLGFGVSYKPADALKLGFDLQWVNWKNAFDKMTLNLTGGTNPNIQRMMGNDGSFEVNFPLNWKDVVLVKLGGEYFVNKTLTLRAGFAYGNNPVPEETVFPVFPAIVQSHVMLGAGYKLTKQLAVNAAYELGIKSNETASNPSTIASEYNGSTSELGTSLFHLSLSWNL